MSSFNPLTSILNQNKLEALNYVDWKRNLDIVLTAEGYKFVIIEECPEKPNEDVIDDQVKAYNKWVKADEMARCYILASMENDLQHQHQSKRSAYNVLESLKEMFGEQNRAAKQTAMKALLNTKMAEGSSIRDHVLKMMGLLNELEVLGVVIGKESQVEMVMQTLPDSFQQFRLNYNMNKMNLSLAKLLNELQVEKSIIKQQAPVVALNVEKASVSKSKGGKKKKKAQKVLVPGGAGAGVKKPKDSGATNHICTTLQGFQENRRLSENEVCIFQANGELTPSLALEYIRVSFSSDGVLVLEDVLYVPSIRRNLILVLKIMDVGYNIYFANNSAVIKFKKCHINLNRISRLVSDGPLSSLKLEALPTCESCLEESYDRIPEEHNTEPLNYDEALQDTNADKWVVALKSEMESMYSNQVWDLVEPPTGVKLIGCKWIYKEKRGVDGKVQTFKARFVAKGFTQKEGIDYEETFSPVAMLKSIRILLSIAAHYNYEIWQMDVKTAFLNGSLDECIYMAQAVGFIKSGNKHMLCKLKKSIYRLKQASRA
ncbi:uncharacterized protein LOC142173574 [Nicotiana tabacum]|uniref:Uncharacterized protein LOC142173574 n=1 Tax=Nicotiana tabacum TaxID=4097 RepID=A0AC58TDJ0_TOBAC